jgi:hypothetical protein
MEAKFINKSKRFGDSLWVENASEGEDTRNELGKMRQRIGDLLGRVKHYHDGMDRFPISSDVLLVNHEEKENWTQFRPCGVSDLRENKFGISIEPVDIADLGIPPAKGFSRERGIPNHRQNNDFRHSNFSMHKLCLFQY